MSLVQIATSGVAIDTSGHHSRIRTDRFSDHFSPDTAYHGGPSLSEQGRTCSSADQSLGTSFHGQFSVDFTTNIAKSDFRCTHVISFRTLQPL